VNQGSLNEIDTSQIEDMSAIFENSKFNSDISNWDVSNVNDMDGMFSHFIFNQDIAQWNT